LYFRGVPYKPLDAFFLLRPILFVPVWAFFCLGYLRRHWENGGLIFFPMLPGPATLVLVSLTLLMGGCYIINQICDYPVDKLNVRGTLLTAEKLSLRFARVEWAVVTLTAFVPVFWYGREVRILLLLSLGLSFAYSLRPFYLTGRPFADFLANAVGYGILAFVLGWYSSGGVEESAGADMMLRNCLPYFFLMAAGCISSTLPDVPGDAKEGKITTAVFLGESRANLLAILLLFLGLAASIWNHDYIAGASVLVSLPFFIRYAVTLKREHGIQSYQLGGAAMLVISLMLFPVVLALSLMMILGTRLYHKRRLGWNYPHLGQ
jgi:4-hydroxybenzoate polyprenyltransferase